MDGIDRDRDKDKDTGTGEDDAQSVACGCVRALRAGPEAALQCACVRGNRDRSSSEQVPAAEVTGARPARRDRNAGEHAG